MIGNGEKTLSSKRVLGRKNLTPLIGNVMRGGGTKISTRISKREHSCPHQKKSKQEEAVLTAKP